MLTRAHKILIGALVVQIILVVVMFLRGDGGASLVEAPLLPGFDAAKVTHLQVFAKDAAKPAVDLVKGDKGWRIASAFDYPIDDAKLAALLGPIAKMAASEPIATQSSRHAQLHVADADYERKLVVTIAGKDTTLFIGAPAGSRRNAVRLGGDDRVYAVAGVTPYLAGTEPRDWMTRRYLDVPGDDVTKVTIKRGAVTTELAKDDSSWKVSIDGTPVTATAPDTLDIQAIDDAVGAATSIDASAPADPRKDASSPTATITVEHKAAGTKPDVIDVVADGTSYWVKSRALDRAVTVDKARLDRALSLGRDSLIRKPTAKPATSPGSGSPLPPGE